jgi:P4 family phage/plasmid primase-like protien
LLQAAHFRVHPLEQRGKKPILPGWVDLATDDPTVGAQWIEHYPSHNIGIVLGFQPYNGLTYFVVDLDIDSEGKDGVEELLQHMMARQVELPPTLVQNTGGGGRQMFFYTSGETRVPNRVGVLPGLDVRGDGGQVVAPPSIHPSGVVYTWREPQCSIAESPQWLLDLAGAVHRSDTTSHRASGGIDAAAQGDPIPEHERNDTLFKIACKLRNKGISRMGILGHLADVNQNRCQPPLSLEELEEIADSAAKYDPGQDLPDWPPKNASTDDLPPSPPALAEVDEELESTDPRNTDRYNALEFARLTTGELIWTPEMGWLVWAGNRWKPDDLLIHEKMIGRLIGFLRYQVSAVTTQEAEVLMKRITRLESAGGCAGCLKFAQSTMARHITDFDTDPLLVNFQNCTLNLRTMTMQPHDPTDLITRICAVNYDPAAVDSTWENFIETALPDVEVRRTFQNFMGSCLTGLCKDKAILIPNGPTDTGKTTAVEPCFNVLGSVSDGGYASTWEAEVVERSRPVNHDEKKNQARGARLIVIGELTRGSRFNDGFLKRFSGGDTVSARALYKSTYDYRPQAKLVMHTNYVPRSPDKALQNRLKLLPFQHVFVERDEGVKSYLENNTQALMAVAAWMVRGYVDWSTNGLGKMPWLEEHMQKYRIDSDPVEAFLIDNMDSCSPEESISVEICWNWYQTYTLASGDKPFTRRAFERALEERGFRKTLGANNELFWWGLKRRSVGTTYTV